MAQDYDNMAKVIFKKHTPDVLQFLLQGGDVVVLENLDTEQQTLVAHRSDTAVRIRLDGQEVIFHLEMQLHDSRPKPMWSRIAGYNGHLLREHLIPVFSNVIYFHPNAGWKDPGSYTYEHGDYEVTLRYKVIRLIEIDGRAVLETQAPGMLPFAPLMKPPAGASSEDWIRECFNATLAAPVDEGTKAELVHGIYVLGGVVHDREMLRRLIPEEIMQESSTYQYLQEKFKREGAAEATIKATRENTRENTLALLEARFQAAAVNTITQALGSVDDLEKLKQLLIAAAQVQDIEAFERMLRE